jgi:hypothetical protein
MTTTNAPTPNRRIRRSARNATIGAVAVLSLGGIWASAGSAGADRPSPSVEQTAGERSPEFDAAISRYAGARGLSGLSPASLASSSQVVGCHGLSVVSAAGCTAGELSGR